MSTFHPHFEILPSAQIQLWKELQPLKKLGFVLYGGTALAHLKPQRMESCR